MRTSDHGFDRFFTRATERHLTPENALTDDHAPCAKCRGLSSVIDADGLCPDCEETDAEAELDADPFFVTVCDLRNARYLAHAMGLTFSEAA